MRIHTRQTPRAQVRTALFDVLNQTYKHVDGLGRCRRTPSKLKYYNQSCVPISDGFHFVNERL